MATPDLIGSSAKFRAVLDAINTELAHRHRRLFVPLLLRR